MTKLILIRHGETEYRAKGLLDGQIDTRLTRKGVLQARALAQKLKTENIDVIYCSPLSRSLRTAELIKKELNLNAPIKIVPEFAEIDCGLCSGKNIKEISSKFPKLMKEWKANTDPRFPKGENLADVEKRVLPALKKIISENSGKTILVSGHGAVNLAILGHYLKIPYGLRWRLKQSNCCINELLFTQEEIKITKINA